MTPIGENLNQEWMQDATELLERFLPLQHWHFNLSTQFFDNETFPVLIFTSNKCRIKALYEAPIGKILDHRVTVHYGRLDTPDESKSLGLRDRENYYLLWQSINMPLRFLSGVSPRAAVNEQTPRAIKEYEESSLAKDISYPPERILTMHATMWKLYGNELFDLLDMQNTELWNRYSEFVREFWETLQHTS